jgi:hypothetical protein
MSVVTRPTIDSLLADAPPMLSTRQLADILTRLLDRPVQPASLIGMAAFGDLPTPHRASAKYHLWRTDLVRESLRKLAAREEAVNASC